MRIAIIGAGAMGSVYAFYLSRRHTVTLVDVSEKRISQLQKAGLCLRHGDKIESIPCNAVKETAKLAPMDLLIVFVKAAFTEQAIRSNKHLIGPDTRILSLQNGYGNWERVYAAAPDAHVLCGTSMHGATMLSDGVVDHVATGLTTFGCLKDPFPIESLAEEFSNCGLPSKAVSNVYPVIWRKVIINSAINGVTALLRANNALLTHSEDAAVLSGKLIEEAVAAANADGCGFDPAEMRCIVRETAETTGNNLSSMLQDILARRHTEADVIYGAILQVSQAHNLYAPYTDALYHLLKATEAAMDARCLLQ